MNKKPINVMLDQLEWNEVENGSHIVGNGDMPHITHEGVLKIGDFQLRCFKLSDGQRVFDEIDFRNFCCLGGIEL